MKALLVTIAITAAAVGGSVLGAAPAKADPWGHPRECQFLGQNYNIWYPCDQYQPWLPYGTAHNPPLGGSAVVPGGDGPGVLVMRRHPLARPNSGRPSAAIE
jgi:hypothetical protein